jgi:phospholipid N-methyltransferase
MKIKYLTEDFQVESNDIVLDIGSAEGNFALSIIDEVKRIYIFEADKEWIEALYATFEPWKEKVVIINKFVSDQTSEESICLDDFIQEKIDFIKGDVEGEELKIMQGAKEIIQKYCPKVLMCTYHKGNDSEALKIFLEKNDYKIHFSAGYIIFLDDPKPPYLRRGLIRAEKQCH